MELTKIIKKMIKLTMIKKLVMYRGQQNGIVYLTFDDGPHPKNTSLILKILKSEGIRVTFFLLGSEIKKYPELARHIVAEGHEVASHGWKHTIISDLSILGFKRQIERTMQIIKKVCAVNTKNYRPPFGKIRLPILIYALIGKIFVVLWSIDSEDDQSRSVKVILNNCKMISKGDIILFHEDNDAIVKALPKIINMLKEKGLKFGKISES